MAEKHQTLGTQEVTTAEAGVTINGTCEVSPKDCNAKVRDTVTFRTALTSVTLDFYDGSPFEEPPPYIVKTGSNRMYTVKDDAEGEYPYCPDDGHDRCDECDKALTTPPKMIIRR